MARVVVERSKSHLVTSQKLEHIQELFQVVIVKTPHCDERSFVEDGDSFMQHGTTFALHLSSSTSQKSVEEAIVYLKAVLEESPDFTVEQYSLTCEEFEMVRKDSRLAVMEYQHKIELGMDPISRELHIKGQRENVEDARQPVHMLLEQHRQQTVHSQPDSKLGHHLSALSSKQEQQQQLLANMPIFNNKLPGYDFRDVDNNVIQESSYYHNYPGPPTRSCSLTTDSPCSLPIDTSMNLIARGSSLNNTTTKTKSFAQVVSDSSAIYVPEEEKDHAVVESVEEERQLETGRHPSPPGPPKRLCSLTTDSPCFLPTDLPVSPVSQEPPAGSVSKAPSKNRSFAQVVSDNSTADVIVEESSPPAGTEEDEQQHILKEEEDKEFERSSTASLDDDSGVSAVDKLDQRYERQLEYAVKLGYTEDDLDRVLHRQGLECDENKLLQELIKSSPGSTGANPGDSEGISKSLSPVSVGMPPDIVSSDEIKGVLDNVSKSEDGGSNLRHIIIDGSNVAMSHGKSVFSCKGIKIAVDWFRQRGHQEITVFVPQWRKEASRPDTPITDQNILTELEQQKIVVFTPSRRINGRRVVCYDDRFILKLAADTNGIVVSNDNYRDLLNENQEFRTVVDERLLMYSFVNDRFMPPEDPLGRQGPTLDNLLCKEPTSPPTLPPECPYGRKCTYGNKCKYHHPERGSHPHKSVTETLIEQASMKKQRRALGKSADSLEKPPQRGKPKLTRTCSLVPGESLPSEKNNGSSSQLPQGSREADTMESSNRLKSPTRVPPSKTSDYLREHRKKLEEALAIASKASMPAAVPAPAQETMPVAAPMPIASPREVLSPVPTLGSRVSSPSHLNVPYSSSQEGGLVSGHLLLAKKLSDDESTSNRASPTALAGPAGATASVSRQESTPSSPFLDTLFDRRLSLQDHHYQYQMPAQQPYFPPPGLMPAAGHYSDASCTGPVQHHGPARQLSAYSLQDQSFVTPGFGAQCQSFPMVEKKEAPAHHNVLRRVTSQVDHHHHHHNTSSALSLAGGLGLETGGGLTGVREHVSVKPQLSGPASHFLPSSSAGLSGRPFKGMMRQNSSSDTQLYVADSGLDPRGPQTLYGSSGLDHRGLGEAHPHHSSASHPHQQQGLSRSTSMQPFPRQQFYSGGTAVPVALDRQTSEVMFGSSHHDQRGLSPGFGQYPSPWDMCSGSLASTPTHQPPPPQFMGMPQSSGMPPWPTSPMHQHSQMAQPPTSPVKQRSFPAEQPIPTKDPRYPLYSHLCNIFAEPRVRAVMNKFPDETDPRKLCSSIMSCMSLS